MGARPTQQRGAGIVGSIADVIAETTLSMGGINFQSFATISDIRTDSSGVEIDVVFRSLEGTSEMHTVKMTAPAFLQFLSSVDVDA